MKTSIWYHTTLECPAHNIHLPNSIPLMLEQMETLKSTGLLDAADELVVCVNGDSVNQSAARASAPKKARFIDNGKTAESLLPTTMHLREWSQTHKDWLVCFFHNKGVTHPGSLFNWQWRKCMEKWVLVNWRRCVRDIDSGLDTVGAHWLTREVYGPQVTFPFWGGMFFWCRASFLSELPVLKTVPTCRDDWFLSENWIGMGRTPKLKDYAPHWPNPEPCGRNA